LHGSSFRPVPEFFQALNYAQTEQLLYPFRSHLLFEIGANVLAGGEHHHLTILISALRHTVILDPIKNNPKLGADLTRLWILMTHLDLRAVESIPPK
jgi:hypothetical protein